MNDILKEIGELSALLRCPTTGQQLHIATREELQTLPPHSADGFLIRWDGNAAYPVLGGIPALLPESMILINRGRAAA